MNSKADTAGSKLDSLKIVVALALVIAATAAFYIFPEQSQLLRVVGILIAVGLAAAIAYTTEKGQQFWAFLQGAQIEVRKVVWPTREETVQTTLIVILVVVFIAIFLWLLDMFLGWSIGHLLGRGS